MAEIIRYVDPDVSGGLGDGTSWADAYASLTVWEAAESTDLVSADDWHHVYCRASAGSVDNSLVLIAAWVTDATHYILVEAAAGDEALKTSYSASRYRLEVTDDRCLEIFEDYTRIKSIQIKAIYDTANFLGAIFFRSPSPASNDMWVDNCRVETSGGGVYYGSFCDDANANIKMRNNIFNNCERWAVSFNQFTTLEFYNNIIYNPNFQGVLLNGDGDADIKNNSIFETTDDVSNASTGTVTVQYNCADDDLNTEFTETTNVQPSGSDPDNEYSDPAAGDFTAITGGNIENNGVGPSTDSNVPTTDIDGTVRSGTTCDIGADEIAGVGPTSIAILRRRRNFIDYGLE